MTGEPKHGASPAECATCGSLQDEEHAYQKWGWEEHDTHLPAAASRLRVVRDFWPFGSRKLQLWQCPDCGTYYLYRTDYEYLVNGSENEEHLARFSPGQAAEYLS